MKYISVFSGVGGLEHPSYSPMTLCEIDESCHSILRRRHPSAEIVRDVRNLKKHKKVDAVVGGFPCQDLSIAGRMDGINGSRSGLFFEMVRVGIESRARHLIAENVPNLLRLAGGKMMKSVLRTLSAHWSFISWRILNAREFGLPQQRKRLIICASNSKASAISLFRDLPQPNYTLYEKPAAAGFYTTAGSRSICYSKGFVPTVKVGSSLSIPGPPGLHIGNIVRKATLEECIAFQGFDHSDFVGVAPKDAHRQIGNAVPVPMGSFALTTLFNGTYKATLKPTEVLPANGFYDGSLYEAIGLYQPPLANNLQDFIGPHYDELSERAASGLVRRLQKSGKPCPASLLRILCQLGRIPSVKTSTFISS